MVWGTAFLLNVSAGGPLGVSKRLGTEALM